MLLAAAREERLVSEAVDLGICADDAAQLRAAIRRALDSGADALITSGAVSAGDRDLLGAHVLAEFGSVLFSLVKMKPGKPLTLTVAPRAGGGRPMLIFSLPGNPVSAYATFQLVVAPALRKLGGHREPRGRTLRVELASSLALDPERPEYHRATLEGGRGAGGRLVAHSTGHQISSRMLSCRQAEVLLELPQGPGVLAAGTSVDALVVRDLRSHAKQPAAALVGRRRVRLRVLPMPAVPVAERGATHSERASGHTETDACIDAAVGALRTAGIEAVLPAGKEAEGRAEAGMAGLGSLFCKGEQTLIVLLHYPTLPLGHALLDKVRAQLGERLLLVPTLAAAVRHAAAPAAPHAVAAQDAAVVDRQSVLLIVDPAADTVSRCVRAVAPALAELSDSTFAS